MLTFGKKLAAIRALLGLRQRDVAQGIDTYRQFYIFLETDRVLPTPEQIEKLSVFFGYNLDDPNLTTQLEKVIEAHEQVRESLPQAA